MNADSLRYLAENTDVTYLAEGSIARALTESSNLEISKINEYISSTYSNTFINSAQGAYLDLIGEMLGVARLQGGPASSSGEDQSVQISVASGTLGQVFPNPANANQGLIQAGFTVKSADATIIYRTSEKVVFPANLTEVFISVVSDASGTSVNVGKGRLVIHDGPSGVSVTNLKSITNGSRVESDRDYRFRLGNSIAGSSTSNEISIRLAVAGVPDISRVQLNEFSRGAGTFDALLVPVGNTLSATIAEISRKAIESVSAFGISSRVTQPTYKLFKVSIQLIPVVGIGQGAIGTSKIAAKNAVLDYFESIPMGGEFVVNRLRAAVIGAISENTKDIRIVDLCLSGRPRAIRNVKLRPDELFSPDNTQGAAVLVV
jgi:uncharacterized phage protein gp47/JayE